MTNKYFSGKIVITNLHIMGVFDLYCSKSGLPMRPLYDNNKDIPKELQKVLRKGVLVLDGKKIAVKDYDDYGNFKNNKGQTIKVGEYIHSGDKTIDLYHKDIHKFPDIIANKDIVKLLFQGQVFDDENYIEFYKGRHEGKERIVYHPNLGRHLVKTFAYLEKEKSCPVGKVLNPDTMRFVSVSGKVGKMILENRL